MGDDEMSDAYRNLMHFAFGPFSDERKKTFATGLPSYDC
jgi:hypothetical protein